MKTILFCAVAACVCMAIRAGDETIHHAVAAAANGATVRVAPGIYRIDRPIVVPAERSVKIVSDDPARTVVDAQGRTNAFVFLSNGANELRGITVRNGRGAPVSEKDETWYAGGIVMKGGLISNCRVFDCETLAPAKALGGGIATWGAVRDTLVSNCAVRVRRDHMGATHPLTCSGGGILLYGGPGASGCTVVDCTAEALEPGTSVGGYGGGVEIFGNAALRNTTVRSCFASMAGGGVHLNSGGHVLDCTIVSNTVKVAWPWPPVNVGGGVSVRSSSAGSRIERTRFEGNRLEAVTSTEAPCGGGGLGAEGCPGLVVRGCTFIGNAAPNGGAAYFNGAEALVSGCAAAGNRAERFGPAFAATEQCRTRCTDCTAAPGETVFEVRHLYPRDTDWMRGAIGVFQHRLYGKCPESLEAMKRIDPKALAAQLADIGADYFCITINQCEPSFLAPNDAYEDMCGYRRGEMCSQRDVPAELYEALQAKGIRLMLYSTGTPPRGDTNGVRRIGYADRGVRTDPLYTREGAERWAKVFEFWSRRYGSRVCGWWIDGCYADLGFVRTGAGELFAKALKAGNPHAAVSFNPGISLVPYSAYEDYICGEINEPFFEACEGRWMDGRQWHLLSYLYEPLGGCGAANLRYLDCEWADWLARVTRNGGCVTIDAASHGTACLLPEAAGQLKRAIAAARGRVAPDSPEGLRLTRQRDLLRRLAPVEAAHIVIEQGQRHFTKRLYMHADRHPDRALVRKDPNGEEIWSDAIQACLDTWGGVCLEMRTYGVDRPIVLKSGQSVWGETSFRSFAPAALKPVSGYSGPVLTAEKGARDVFVNSVAAVGVTDPFVFENVEGLVARYLRVEGCRGTVVRLAGVKGFRIDGVRLQKTSPGALACGISADAASGEGMARNVFVHEGAAPMRMLDVPDGILIDNVEAKWCAK